MPIYSRENRELVTALIEGIEAGRDTSGFAEMGNFLQLIKLFDQCQDHAEVDAWLARARLAFADTHLFIHMENLYRQKRQLQRLVQQKRREEQKQAAQGKQQRRLPAPPSRALLLPAPPDVKLPTSRFLRQASGKVLGGRSRLTVARKGTHKGARAGASTARLPEARKPPSRPQPRSARLRRGPGSPPKTRLPRANRPGVTAGSPPTGSKRKKSPVHAHRKPTTDGSAGGGQGGVKEKKPQKKQASNALQVKLAVTSATAAPTEEKTQPNTPGGGVGEVARGSLSTGKARSPTAKKFLSPPRVQVALYDPEGERTNTPTHIKSPRSDASSLSFGDSDGGAKTGGNSLGEDDDEYNEYGDDNFEMDGYGDEDFEVDY